MPAGERPAADVRRERFRIGDLVVDAADASVRRGAERLVLPPRTFDLLLVLAERSPRLVRRTELLDSVWRDEHVSDQTLSHRVMVLRKALGDHAARPAYVAGERGFGYRLVVPVERLVEPAGGFPKAPPRRRRALSSALAVLAAAGLGTLAWARIAARPPGADGRQVVSVRAVAATPQLQVVADALGGAVAAGLRRVPGARVVTGGRDAGAPVGLRAEIACRGTPEAVRAIVRLVEGPTGRPAWTAEVAGDAFEVLEREGAIANAVARAAGAALEPERGPLAPAVLLSTRSARHAVRAEERWYRWTRAGLADAANAWSLVAADVPRDAEAHSGAALAEAVAGLLGYEPPTDAGGRARAHLHRATVLAPEEPATRLAAGLVRLLFDGDVRGADAEIRPAVAEDADDDRGPLVLAMLELAEGRFDEAAELTRPAASPFPGTGASLLLHARALEGREDWVTAARAYDEALRVEESLVAARVGRAACLARAGRSHEPAAAVRSALAGGAPYLALAADEAPFAAILPAPGPLGPALAAARAASGRENARRP
ncbi:MAG: winged helix-turn-helix domain-containing protein [Vicinamibacteria bacterium]